MAAADGKESKTTATTAVPKRRRCIIDCDPGVDDSMALLLALAAPDELQVDALTRVFGHSDSVTVLASNACMLLQMVQGENKKHGTIVVPGAMVPLVRNYSGQSGIVIHGSDGIGNLPPALQPVPRAKVDMTPLVTSKHVTAASHMVAHCLANPGEITLVSLGPMTNLALAIALGGAPFVKAVHAVHCMGGSFTGRGNRTPAAEANIHNDVDAAAVVFKTFPKICLAPLDVTRQIPLDDAFRARMATGSPAARFCFNISAHYCKLLSTWGSLTWMHDPTTIMALIRPDLFKSTATSVRVETQGELCCGVTVSDWGGRWLLKKNVHVWRDVKLAAYYAEFLARIGSTRIAFNEEQPKYGVLSAAAASVDDQKQQQHSSTLLSALKRKASESLQKTDSASPAARRQKKKL
jgi:inosine-uridine nucleoside N-ribohydrolase